MRGDNVEKQLIFFVSLGFQTVKFGSHPRKVKGFKILLTKSTKTLLDHGPSPSVAGDAQTITVLSFSAVEHYSFGY